MVDTARVTDRRTVHFANLAEMQADAEQMAVQNPEVLGNWSFGQILQHLANAMNCAFDGFGFRAPWIARMCVAPFIKNSFMIKAMPAGLRLPGRAKKLLPAEVPVSVGLQNFRNAVARFESATPDAVHPFFGKLASQEWVLLALRHAELHLSFVRLPVHSSPGAGGVSGTGGPQA